MLRDTLDYQKDKPSLHVLSLLFFILFTSSSKPSIVSGHQPFIIANETSRKHIRDQVVLLDLKSSDTVKVLSEII